LLIQLARLHYHSARQANCKTNICHHLPQLGTANISLSSMLLTIAPFQGYLHHFPRSQPQSKKSTSRLNIYLGFFFNIPWVVHFSLSRYLGMYSHRNVKHDIFSLLTWLMATCLEHTTTMRSNWVCSRQWYHHLDAIHDPLLLMSHPSLGVFIEQQAQPHDTDTHKVAAAFIQGEVRHPKINTDAFVLRTEHEHLAKRYLETTAALYHQSGAL
jgi:hypothetical protein